MLPTTATHLERERNNRPEEERYSVSMVVVKTNWLCTVFRLHKTMGRLHSRCPAAKRSCYCGDAVASGGCMCMPVSI
uniref:Uncharacterized protein n=1 Tax=Amphiprion ocellaris TaxID=80972 RepID=A0A3Q1BJ09_AMPOC